MKTAVIGVGNIGSKYASLIFDGKIKGMELAALTRMRPPYSGMLKAAVDSGVPVYIKLKEILESGKYGELKRVNWIVTDWYRPEKYYTSSSWHATWKKDGGGVLLNQAPHNLFLSKQISLNTEGSFYRTFRVYLTKI